MDTGDLIDGPPQMRDVPGAAEIIGEQQGGMPQGGMIPEMPMGEMPPEMPMGGGMPPEMPMEDEFPPELPPEGLM
jgi:hypothetical protein